MSPEEWQSKIDKEMREAIAAALCAGQDVDSFLINVVKDIFIKNIREAQREIVWKTKDFMLLELARQRDEMRDIYQKIINGFLKNPPTIEKILEAE